MNSTILDHMFCSLNPISIAQIQAFTLFTKTQQATNMVFVTVCDAFEAKLAAFVSRREFRRSASKCSLTNMSRCHRSERPT